MEEYDARSFFIRGMSRSAAQVSVVTTDGAHGRTGVTVSAMNSVSADGDRPTLLVCVHHLSPAGAAILGNRVFCVNVLRDDQSFIADTFAGRIVPADNDKFSCHRWSTGSSGAPVASEPLVAFDCELSENFRFGTHHIFIGEVIETIIHDAHSPLIYANRTYGTPSTLDDQISGLRKSGSNNRLRIACFMTLGPNYLPQLVDRMLARHPEADISLVEGHQGQIIESLRSDQCDIALTYDFNIDRNLEIEHLAALAPHVLLTSSHRLAGSDSLSLQELDNEPFILLETPPSSHYFTELFRSQGLKPNLLIRSTSFETVRGLVGQGLGFSVLVTRPAGNLTYSGQSVAVIPLADELPPSPLVLVRRSDKPASRLIKAFRSICRDYIASEGR